MGATSKGFFLLRFTLDTVVAMGGSMVVTVSTRRDYVFSTRLLAVPWGAVGGTSRHLKLNEYS